MSGQIGEFIAKVIETLQKNGYPEKKVALPLDTMYERAADQGYSFNKVLEFLKEKEGIDHEKTTERIIFFPVREESDEPQSEMNLNGLMMQAAEMLKHMSPEQLTQIRTMVENLSEEERRDLLEKAKDFGFTPPDL